MAKFLEYFGVFLMAIGSGAVIASVEPTPETPAYWIVGVATAGFLAIVQGNRLRVAAGGKPLADF